MPWMLSLISRKVGFIPTQKVQSSPHSNLQVDWDGVALYNFPPIYTSTYSNWLLSSLQWILSKYSRDLASEFIRTIQPQSTASTGQRPCQSFMIADALSRSDWTNSEWSLNSIRPMDVLFLPSSSRPILDLWEPSTSDQHLSSDRPQGSGEGCLSNKLEPVGVNIPLPTNTLFQRFCWSGLQSGKWVSLWHPSARVSFAHVPVV